MPDFEIRYFHAYGSLAIVHVTAAPTRAEAEQNAKSNQENYSHFEVHEMKGAMPRASALL